MEWTSPWPLLLPGGTSANLFQRKETEEAERPLADDHEQTDDDDGTKEDHLRNTQDVVEELTP